MKTAIVLGVNADIGRNIGLQLINDDYQVIGTYRQDFEYFDSLAATPGMTLIRCDVTNAEDPVNLARLLRERQVAWDFLFSSVGSSEPIGRFFELDFVEWERSVDINFIGQMRVLHALYGLRRLGAVVDIGLLAGGGTNNPFRCYSAYCVAKIALIKMCELIDDEAADVNIFIVGPGFVRTKTHYETLKAGAAAEENLERVRDFIASDTQGTSFNDIYRCLMWACSIGRTIVGGRNLSVVHDAWGTTALADALAADANMYKLRRAGNGLIKK